MDTNSRRSGVEANSGLTGSAGILPASSTKDEALRPSSSQARNSPAGCWRSRWGRIALRIATLLLVATAVGWTLDRVEAAMAQAGPAGFRRGIIQGALMPMSLPNLLLGRDVIIYAQHNTGMTYKLGYTMGVNGCGALFFGLFFWRVSKWRRGR